MAGTLPLTAALNYSADGNQATNAIQRICRILSVMTVDHGAYGASQNCFDPFILMPSSRSEEGNRR
jgi:hypothetical protein